MLEVAEEALRFHEDNNLTHGQRKIQAKYTNRLMREYNERYPKSAWLFPSERFLPESDPE